jgi:hypothetical protein
MTAAKYRIDFQIQRADTEGEFEEIGFGSCSAWDTLDEAVRMLSWAVQNGCWETEAGQTEAGQTEAGQTERRAVALPVQTADTGDGGAP